MFTSTLDRSSARRLTVLMLGIAGLGVLGVGAIAIGGQGRLPEPPPQNAGRPTEPVAPASEEDAGGRLRPKEYASDVAGSLSLAYDWQPEPEEPDESPRGPDRAEGGGGAEPGEAPVKYLGSIIGPDRRLAIVSIDGRQRILAEGREADGVRLERVSDERIIIRRDGTPEQIAKAQPDGPMVTMIAGASSSSPASGGAGENASDGSSGSNPGGSSSREVEDPRERAMRLRRERLERLNADEREARLEALRRSGASVNDGVVTTPGGTGTRTRAVPSETPRNRDRP